MSKDDSEMMQELDLSWLDVVVQARPGEEIIVAHSPGWKDLGIDLPYLCDNFEHYDPPTAPGLYRWSGYQLGCWQEDEPFVAIGGTWTPYTLAATPPSPLAMRDDVETRSSQYKELSMSKNHVGKYDDTPLHSKHKDYKIETRDRNSPWVLRSRSLSESYLDSLGRRWIEGKFCDQYRISLIKNKP
jgi:hypothetical protein